MCRNLGLLCRDSGRIAHAVRGLKSNSKSALMIDKLRRIAHAVRGLKLCHP